MCQNIFATTIFLLGQWVPLQLNEEFKIARLIIILAFWHYIMQIEKLFLMWLMRRVCPISPQRASENHLIDITQETTKIQIHFFNMKSHNDNVFWNHKGFLIRHYDQFQSVLWGTKKTIGDSNKINNVRCFLGVLCYCMTTVPMLTQLLLLETSKINLNERLWSLSQWFNLAPDKFHLFN